MNYRKKIVVAITIFMSIILFACESKIRTININGIYRGNSMMAYEAVVEKGVITIYSTSFFEKEVYWYGTCHANELDENNMLISKRLERERDNNFFGFGRGMNESYVSEKKIQFTDDSLTFIYDFSGMSVSQVTLYKDTKKNKRPKNDSNADEVPQTETYPYIEPMPETKESEKEIGEGNTFL